LNRYFSKKKKNATDLAAETINSEARLAQAMDQYAEVTEGSSAQQKRLDTEIADLTKRCDAKQAEREAAEKAFQSALRRVRVRCVYQQTGKRLPEDVVQEVGCVGVVKAISLAISLIQIAIFSYFHPLRWSNWNWQRRKPSKLIGFGLSS
jgi:DNA-directed RNA polymerase sigma subunit (sigma70/sigma32)